MIFKIVFSVLLVFLAKDVFTQDVVPSVSNFFRYGNGERIFGEVKIPQTYFENLSDVRISLPYNLAVGFRLLYDDPPEIGETFKGISRRYIEYNYEEFYLRAGNSSALFGRGLAVNFFENRGLAFDTWMDGIKLKYSSDFFNAVIIGGNIDFRDSINFVRNEEYKIRAANFELFPFNELLIGLSYVNSDGIIPQGNISVIPPEKIKAEIPEVYLSLNLDNISLYLDWSRKWTNVLTQNSASAGNGFYGAVSYFGRNFGITLDYKNYAYDILDPYGRSDFGRATRILPFQNPPIVRKEHSYTLLSRALHDVDFNDEVGFQIDAFLSLSSNTTFNFNYSLSSIHDSYDLNPDGFTFSRIKRSGNFLPSIKKEFFPYYEFFIEGEHYYNSSSAIRLAFALREKTFYNEFSQDKSYTITRSFVIPVQIQRLFTPDYSIILQSEQEWVSESFVNSKFSFFNHLIAVTGTLYSKLTATIRYEYTTNDTEVTDRKNWTIGEIGYRLSNSHSVTVSYGSERGGQICSNGICRYILPFEGFRISILSQI